MIGIWGVMAFAIMTDIQLKTIRRFKLISALLSVELFNMQNIGSCILLVF